MIPLSVLPALFLVFPLVAGCDKLADMDMYNQPKHAPETVSTFYEDGTSARPLVPGTIPRPWAPLDRAGQPGNGVGGTSAGAPGTPGGDPMAADPSKIGPKGFPANFPSSGDALAETLQHGQERYNIYCSVCHGYNGQGDGMIAQRGFTRPPAYYPLEKDKSGNPQLYARELHLVDPNTPIGRHVYDVITNGYGAMYSYGDRVPPADRWAIAAYIIALQQARPEMTTPPPGADTGPSRTRGTSP